MLKVWRSIFECACHLSLLNLIHYTIKYLMSIGKQWFIVLGALGGKTRPAGRDKGQAFVPTRRSIAYSCWKLILKSQERSQFNSRNAAQQSSRNPQPTVQTGRSNTAKKSANIAAKSQQRSITHHETAAQNGCNFG